jgi:NADH-quinone oxidoreductase subunit J
MEYPILDLLFYTFAGLVLFSGLMVISARNPVHSVLFLIFTFFNAAGLFVLLGAEYLAMTLVIVYVGAVAVLFLFVVMMMDIDFAKWREGFIRQLPVGIGLAMVLMVSFGVVFYSVRHSNTPMMPSSPIPAPDVINNTEAIGRVLYTDFAYPFLVSGLVLLVAMIGAIVLTLRQRTAVKRQNIGKQLRRTRAEAVGLVDAPKGKGVAL